MTSRCCAHFSRSVLLTTLGSVETVTSSCDLEYGCTWTDGCAKNGDRRPGPDLCVYYFTIII